MDPVEASITQADAEGASGKSEDKASGDAAIVWRACLHLPTEGSHAERGEAPGSRSPHGALGCCQGQARC